MESLLHCLNPSLNDWLWSVKIGLSSCQADNILASFSHAASQVAQHHGLGGLQVCHSGIKSLSHSCAAWRHSCCGSCRRKLSSDYIVVEVQLQILLIQNS